MTSARVRDGEARGLRQGVPDHEVVIIGSKLRGIGAGVELTKRGSTTL